MLQEVTGPGECCTNFSHLIFGFTHSLCMVLASTAVERFLFHILVFNIFSSIFLLFAAIKSEYSEDFYHSKDLKSQFNDAAASDHGSATSDIEPKVYDDADIVRLIHTSTTGGSSPKGEKKNKKKSKVKSPKGSKVLIPGSISDVEIPVLSSSQLDFLDPATVEAPPKEQPKKAKKKKSDYSDSEQDRQVAELVSNISINNGSVESAENSGFTSRAKGTLYYLLDGSC